MLPDVVDAEIPLLISKPAMKRMGIKIDFVKDEAIINGKILKLQSSSSGHYVIHVTEWTDDNCEVVLHLEHFKDLPYKEKASKAKKIHRQFAHATKDSLIRLLKMEDVMTKNSLTLLKMYVRSVNSV